MCETTSTLAGQLHAAAERLLTAKRSTDASRPDSLLGGSAWQTPNKTARLCLCWHSSRCVASGANRQSCQSYVPDVHNNDVCLVCRSISIMSLNITGNPKDLLTQVRLHPRRCIRITELMVHGPGSEVPVQVQAALVHGEMQAVGVHECVACMTGSEACYCAGALLVCCRMRAAQQSAGRWYRSHLLTSFPGHCR